jgi:hypothetical protein
LVSIMLTLRVNHRQKTPLASHDLSEFADNHEEIWFSQQFEGG